MMTSEFARRRRTRGERGFILALGLLMLAALALIGTMALSTASFQNDQANSARQNQQLYYAATMGLSQAMQQMIRVKPVRNTMTRSAGEPYDVGAIDGDGNVIPGNNTCAAGDHACICKTVLPYTKCIDYYVDVELKNYGNAPPRWGIGKYFTYYYKVTATASGFQGATSSVSLYLAAVYPPNYR